MRLTISCLFFVAMLAACGTDGEGLGGFGSTPDAMQPDGTIGRMPGRVPGFMLTEPDASVDTLSAQGGAAGTVVAMGGAGGAPEPVGGMGGDDPPVCEPTPEVCDGEDNNCDDQVDEDDVCGRPLADGCANDDQCASGACVQGRCCEAHCDDECNSCNAQGRCIQANDGTQCGAKPTCAPRPTMGDKRSPAIVRNECHAGECIEVRESCFGHVCLPGSRPVWVAQKSGCVGPERGAAPYCELVNHQACPLEYMCNETQSACVAP